MKLFPLTFCLFLASSVNQMAQASGCFTIDPSGRKIEMDFCGVNGSRQPSAATYESENSRQPASSSEETQKPEQIQEQTRVTNDQWQEIKSLVAQRGDKNPVYYQESKILWDLLVS